jgi:hypothetical protein
MDAVDHSAFAAELLNNSREDIHSYARMLGRNIVIPGLSCIRTNVCMFCNKTFNKELPSRRSSFEHMGESIPGIFVFCEGCKTHVAISDTFEYVNSLALAIPRGALRNYSVAIPNYDIPGEMIHARLSRTTGEIAVAIHRSDGSIKYYFLPDLVKLNPWLPETLISHLIPLEGYPQELSDILLARVAKCVPKKEFVEQPTN